jgi:nicotinate-nucleotide pyrophosphorylase (carboxylating)
MSESISEFGPAIDDLIERSLLEDLAAGDVTARCTVPVGARANATIIAKQSLRVCGGEVAAMVFRRVDVATEVQTLVDDGERVEPGRACLRVSGAARSLLAAERVALNLLQRASGVSTLTADYVAAAGDRLRITDTRKTMPGLRALDRYAVRMGGGFNHRNDLGSGVLIKENHIRAAGSVEAAVRGARLHAPHGIKVECEVTTFDELREALDAGAEVVMLDNMDDQQVEAALRIVDGRALVEVSGGITLERLPRLAALGVDVVSVGALTHSVPAVDLSMLFDRD